MIFQLQILKNIIEDWEYQSDRFSIESLGIISGPSTFISAIPNNLYGENDNFSLNDSHVIPALIRKVWEAKTHNESAVFCWGDGTPVREFTYSEDIARILLFLLEKANVFR